MKTPLEQLGELIKCLAQLGGYLGRNGDPPPGEKAIWEGIRSMYMIAVGIELSEVLGNNK